MFPTRVAYYYYDLCPIKYIIGHRTAEKDVFLTACMYLIPREIFKCLVMHCVQQI